MEEEVKEEIEEQPIDFLGKVEDFCNNEDMGL